MKKKYRIVKDNAKSLRGKSKEIILPIDNDTRTFALDLLEYLKSTTDENFCRQNHCREGVGLAAPQLGKNIRIIAINYDVDLDDDNKKHIQYLLANPKIITNSVKKCYLTGGEGCLSVDKEHAGYVHRYYKITVKAYDLLNDKETTIDATGFDAIVLQHEIDHLDGILFYDHIDQSDPFKVLPDSIKI